MASMQRTLPLLGGTTLLAGSMLCCLLIVSGCAATAPPTSSEVVAAQASGQMVVLLRVATRSSTGESVKLFGSSLADDNVGVAVGSFATGAKVRQIEDMRFLSEDSRADGWLFLLAPRGTQYFAFLPPRRSNAFEYIAMFNRAKRWRVDAPTAATLVYAGSLIFEAEERPLLFGGSYISHLRPVEVRDESETAKTLVKRHVPDVDGIETVLMVEHHGPIILTTPAK